MGCSGSKSEVVSKDRQRLSVGYVDGKEDEPAAEQAGNAKEEDRGLMAQFDKESLLDLIEKVEAEAGDDGGARRSQRKSTLSSVTDDSTTSFANKQLQQLGDQLDAQSSGLGFTCRKGLKPESPNQDSWFVLMMDKFSMFGVFDGHGQKGHHVSNMVKDILPKLVITDARCDTQEWGLVLNDAFVKTQEIVTASDKLQKVNAQMSGTTATVAIVDKISNIVHLAHVADSTACWATKDTENGEWTCVAVTRDHKPNLKDEKARIEKAGGRVVWDGACNHRVYAKNARYPGLNMSRCLGDLLGHNQCGISCIPEIKNVDIDMEKEQRLLLCSDGVWEFLSAQDASDIVKKFSAEQAQRAADTLAKAAWDRWIKEEGGAVVDDITVLLVYLGKNSGS